LVVNVNEPIDNLHARELQGEELRCERRETTI
jgi:hypothetical protein